MTSKKGIIILVFFSSLPVWADQVATSSLQFTLLSQGARESAMGGSFAAVSDDAIGAFCNPAALVQMRQSEISLSHLSWIGRTNEETLAYAQPLEGLGMLGSGLSLYWVPAFDNTGGLENAFSPLTYQGILSYGSNLGLAPLSLGGTLKYAGSSFGNLQQTSSLSLNLGAFYQADWKPLRLGVAAENIGLAANIQNPQAFSLRGGVAFKLDDGLIALEMVRVVGQDFSFQLGGEYWFKDVLALRAGVKAQDAAGSFLGFSFGVGLKVESDYRLDYAASTMGDLGLVQWISLGLVFGAPENSLAKSSPTPGFSPAQSPEPAPAYQKAQAVLPKGTIPRLSPPYQKSFDVFQKALVKTPSQNRRSPLPVTYEGIQGFPVSVNISNNSVDIDWNVQSFEGVPVVGYNVYVSIVPGADFKKLNDKPLSETHWSTEVGLRGMTYYFLVKAVGPYGVEVKSSELKDVLLQ